MQIIKAGNLNPIAIAHPPSTMNNDTTLAPKMNSTVDGDSLEQMKSDNPEVNYIISQTHLISKFVEKSNIYS